MQGLHLLFGLLFFYREKVSYIRKERFYADRREV
jgi:hypothetical protein